MRALELVRLMSTIGEKVMYFDKLNDARDSVLAHAGRGGLWYKEETAFAHKGKAVLKITLWKPEGNCIWTYEVTAEVIEIHEDAVSELKLC